MKTILFTLIILILLESYLFSEELLFFPIFRNSNLNFTNNLIKNGSTPCLLDVTIEEKRAPEINLMEELERELIEIDTFQRCA